MRASTTLMLAGIAILAIVVGCNGTEQKTSGPDTAGKMPGISSTPADPGQPAGRQGKVVETMNSGGYTYAKVEAGGGQNWYAAPETQVAVGDSVILPANPMAMKDFESKTLGRTFDLVYFVNALEMAGGAEAGSAVREAHGSAPAAVPGMDLTGIEKAEGGLTVSEVFAAGAGAAGREVVLRGKVVKYNAGILGKNWVHVRDGTGDAGTNDITVTTQDTAKVGDMVLVTGKLAADRDFGYGYKYPLLIEDAKLVVE